MLSIINVSKSFGGIKAVNDCSLEIKENSITGLIGPNGAGKSTLFDLITGFQRADKGEIYFKNELISGLDPHIIALKGIVKTFQIPRPFPKMTVLENMLLSPKKQIGENIFGVLLRSSVVKEQETKNLEKALKLLKFMNLIDLKDEYAGNLSTGQMKLLELARALMVDPELLLLDEPVAGVNPVLTKELLDHIRELQKNGKTFFIVEHNMEVMMELCEHIFVMHNGKVISSGSPEEIRNDERVLDAYLGE
ncbi:MAG: ABC transporter ATP-binding protein [Candidatus Hydrothermarchaeota archaeon]